MRRMVEDWGVMGISDAANNATCSYSVVSTEKATVATGGAAIGNGRKSEVSTSETTDGGSCVQSRALFPSIGPSESERS